ncbi:DUF6228 family protein [Shewanella carassii]|uniref:DUF6228 family protein n=2 Tax=Shewanella carassii TaxID=1987584 RepID=UPI00227B533D|nr:DUF6228 family protein [Shewanella carassii]
MTISGEGMQASVRVDNLPYGRNPADFFEELARQWQGWQGEQSWAVAGIGYERQRFLLSRASRPLNAL